MAQQCYSDSLHNDNTGLVTIICSGESETQFKVEKESPGGYSRAFWLLSYWNLAYGEVDIFKQHNL